jgi:hypothetical protein
MVALYQAMTNSAIFIPAGVFQVTNIIVPDTCKYIVGLGAQSVLAYANDAAVGTVITTTNTCVIKDLTLTCLTNASFNTASAVHAVTGLVSHARSEGTRVSGVTFTNLQIGLAIKGSTDTTARLNRGIYADNWFTNCTWGILLAADGAALVLDAGSRQDELRQPVRADTAVVQVPPRQGGHAVELLHWFLRRPGRNANPL